MDVDKPDVLRLQLHRRNVFELKFNIQGWLLLVLTLLNTNLHAQINKHNKQSDRKSPLQHRVSCSPTCDPREPLLWSQSERGSICGANRDRREKEKGSKMLRLPELVCFMSSCSPRGKSLGKYRGAVIFLFAPVFTVLCPRHGPR